MEQQNGLKLIVLVLGVVLIGGALFMLATIGSKLSESKSAQDALLTCAKEKEITLSKLGEVATVEQVGAFLRLGIADKTSGKFSIVTIDPCANKVVSRIAIITR